MQCSDPLAQPGIGLPPFRRPDYPATRKSHWWRSPRCGTTQPPDSRPDQLLFNEFEPFDGIDPVSRANQAAAFDKISRSILSWRFSRRRRPSSWRSAVVRPSVRRPSFSFPKEARTPGSSRSPGHPVADRLRRRLKLPRQLFRVAARPHQLDHLSPELRRICTSSFRHRGLPPSQKMKCPRNGVNSTAPSVAVP